MDIFKDRDFVEIEVCLLPCSGTFMHFQCELSGILSDHIIF